FKNIRIMFLLYILLLVAAVSWLAKARTTDWDKPLSVVVYSINGDGSEVSQQYIDKLEKEDFDSIEIFFSEQAIRYRLPLKNPVDVAFAGQIQEQPPLPPRNPSTLSIMFWSLQLRYWVWSIDDYPYQEDITIFVRYFDPETTPTVAHSLGLQKGLIGIVNAFSRKDMKQENNFVIAHELLHTVGAIDKYDPATNKPIYPIGYAEPDKEPLYPQQYAEIMAGRIPVTENKIKQPSKLKQVILGKETAQEINWLARPD
ncbi:MAG: hypothetical protein AAF410_02205, partial [Pseudomonadota bacterium]